MDFYKFMVRVLAIMRLLQNTNQKQKSAGEVAFTAGTESGFPREIDEVTFLLEVP